jgi:hypothetical protein
MQTRCVFAVILLVLGACDATLSGGQDGSASDIAAGEMIDAAAPDGTLPGDGRPDAADDTGVPDGPADGTIPDGPKPDGPKPDGPTPDGPTPDGPTPDTVTPDTATPDTATPDTAPPVDSAPTPDGPVTVCGAQALLTSLGKTHLLAGAAMADSVATQAPFDLRYQYLAGGIFDGTAPCASCATGCTAGGTSCAGGGCNWWGCWQWDQDPPGQFLRDFFTKVIGDGQIPMITYYEILQASGVAEGQPEVTVAAPNTTLMQRYYADWRFALQQIGTKTVLLHIEPDFWGYAQQVGPDPTTMQAAVASANPTDCAGQPNTIAGMGKCMIAMVRKYAPNAKVGLHASAWASGPDVNINTNPALDIVAEANKVGAFLAACGAADGDYVVVEASDRDAGYYSSIGQNKWWDATNATLPSFNQHFAWAKALAEKVGRPLLWWQLPVGNMSLPNVTTQWHDNRVDYFFSHTQQVAGAHGVGMAFGAGAGGQTTPSTDNGNLVAKVTAYAAAGGQPPICP